MQIYMQSRIIFTLQILLLLVFCTNCDAKSIKVGITNFPPLYVTSKANAPSGILFDKMQATLENAGINYEFVTYPPKRLYHYLKIGKIDLYGGIKAHKEYADSVIFSESSIANIELRLYTLNSKVLLDSTDALLGKRVGLIRGYSYGGARSRLLEKTNLHLTSMVTTHRQALKMLSRGRFEYLLDYRQPVDTELAINPVKGIQHRTMNKFSIHFILNRQVPRVKELMESLETSYSQLYQ